MRQAVWNGRGGGSKSLVFSTVVQAGDLAPTGVAIAGPVTFPTGAAIRDKERNDLNPAASGEFPKARVDAVGPSVSNVGQISIAGKLLSMRVTFTEPVTVRGKPSIPFTLAGAPRQLVYAGGAGSQVLVFTYRATSGETPTVETVTASTPVIALGSGRLIDGAGNVAASLAPPAKTSLSAASLPENEPAGAVVGVLAAVDADGARDRHTFALVGGPGSTDNSAFEIVGNQLRTARPLDRESQATYSVRVRATDSGGLWFDEVFTLTAAEVNEAPTGVSLSNTTPTIFENASTTGRIKVADIVITDDALVTDTVTLTGTDSGSFEVDRLEHFQKSGVSLDFETKQSYAVTVNVADASIPGSAPVTAGFTLTVADVNDLAPAFTSGPTGSVAENAEISTAIYTAATTDTDGSPANRAVTYSIKPGVGDASLVQIDAATGVVTLPASANFELNPSYAFTVVATNVGTGATLVSEQAVTVAVSDVNEAPTGVALTSTVSSLPENTSTASRIKVADIAITDDSLGTNTITLSGADSGSFEVDGLALFLKSGVTLNFETKQSYAVTVSVGDASIPGSTPVTMGFTLSVTNTNETPTDITLPPTNIAENAGVNAVVGLLGTVDPDTGNTFTYTLVAGTGSTDNASFNISGNELRATASLDFEARRYYSVRVRSTDQGGLFTEEQFPITVTDIVEMQFVTVGNVGNSPDPATGSLYGAVNYQYGIGAYEVTIGQYTAFLNAVAQSDPYSLYSTSMASDLNIAGIARSGTAGSYTYSVMNNGGDSSD
ncbi:MAG: cadherin domain-containing protein, partial [Planctomycetia bacterium]